MSKKEKISRQEVASRLKAKMRSLGIPPDEITAICLLMIEEDIHRIAEKLAGSDE